MARLDEEGFVYIVDRAKDMLIRGGENVYCVEIEGVLHEHAAVADAAVIGIPHPVLGRGGRRRRAPAARHVGVRGRDPGTRGLPPGRFQGAGPGVVLNQPLPRNPAGKVLKRQLRDELVGTDPN